MAADAFSEDFLIGLSGLGFFFGTFIFGCWIWYRLLWYDGDCQSPLPDHCWPPLVLAALALGPGLIGAWAWWVAAGDPPSGAYGTPLAFVHWQCGCACEETFWHPLGLLYDAWFWLTAWLGAGAWFLKAMRRRGWRFSLAGLLLTVGLVQGLLILAVVTWPVTRLLFYWPYEAGY